MHRHSTAHRPRSRAPRVVGAHRSAPGRRLASGAQRPVRPLLRVRQRKVAASLCVTAATQVWHRSIGPRREAPLRRRRGPGGVGRRGAVVCASHCWGTTCPSGPTASRATRTHARSTIFALRAIRPVRVHASAWSPKASTSPPHPGGPQRLAHKGSGRRKLRRRAKSIAWGGSTQAGARYCSQPGAGLWASL